MPKKLTNDELKKIIFEAFKDVRKGEGLGVRECQALDDYAAPEPARAKDVEQHWWEYPEELKKFSFSQALNYNNKDGIKFHLPALMTSVVDGVDGGTTEITIDMHLCEDDLASKNYDRAGTRWPPHRYHRKYVQFIKGVSVSKIIAYYEFSQDQVRAIALYLLWCMQNGWQYHFFDAREAMVAWIKQNHERVSKKSIEKGNYDLTLEDAIAIMDEEHRIVRDWLKAGNVEA